jgi:hypothetical protein
MLRETRDFYRFFLRAVLLTMRETQAAEWGVAVPLSEAETE